MTDNSTYRIINLSSGDNIIGQVIRKGEFSLTIYRPFQMKIITMMDTAGPNNMFRQEALVMRNWLELSKEQKVKISHSQIVAISEPSDNVSSLYNEEKEKEDNPAMMESLIEKLKNSGDLDEDFMEHDDFIDTVSENMTIEIDPEDMRDIISRLIADAQNLKDRSSEEDEEDINKDPSDSDTDYYDTDKDMFGW